MAQLRINLFGSPSVTLDGANVIVDTRKAIALLAYLVITGKEHSRDVLATLLWPEYGQVNARSALRRTLSVLQKALGGEFLAISREMIGRDQDSRIDVDVVRFRHHLKIVGEHSHKRIENCAECLAHLEAAIELYRGDFLVGFTLRDSPNFDEWQFYESESLKRELNSALEVQINSTIRRYDYPRALDYAQRWLALDPLREDAHRTLMLIYAWSGQRNAALRQYRECVRILDRELGVLPLDETTQLYEAIIENRTPLPPPIQEAHHQQHFGGENQDSGSDEHIPDRPIARGRNYPMVGRSLESVTLEKAYRECAANGHFFIIEGEAGIGKTRLAAAFLAAAEAQGARVIRSQCYAGEEKLAFGPIITGVSTFLDEPGVMSSLQDISPQNLSEAGRLLPDLNILFHGLPAPSPLSNPGAQMRFFEGLRQLILNLLNGPLPGILFLDDLHWADAATLDFLSYLARRLVGHPILLLVTWSDHNLPETLRQIVAMSVQTGFATRIHLDRLKENDITELVRVSSQGGVKFTDQMTARLYRETEGLPFFTIEYLEAIAATLSLQQINTNGALMPTIDEWSMPQAVRDALLSRLLAAGETGWQLLTTAAVIGRSFDFDTLLAASGRSETETVSSLENLIGLGLIEEQQVSPSGVVAYDFTHDKLRRLAYEETTLTRRRLIHRRVAEALVAQMRNKNDPFSHAIQVAQHYQNGGQEAKAAEYYKMAGEHARLLYANQEAISNFQAALTAGHTDAALLHESIGDLQTLQGNYRVALNDYETAASLSEPSARLEQKIGNLHHRRGDWELAACHYQLALEIITSDGNPAERARIYADLSLSTHHLSKDELALEYAQQALTLAQQAGDDLALATAHNILGILSRHHGQSIEAADHFEQSLAIANKLGEPFARVAALNNQALICRDTGAFEQSISYLQKALEICKAHGDRHREAALLNHLADLYHLAGDEKLSLSYLKEAVIIFSEIGVTEGSIQPEIWKLTEW